MPELPLEVTGVEPEGMDTIVTVRVDGNTTPMMAKSMARARAIKEAGLGVPKNLKDRQRITKIEQSRLDKTGKFSYRGEIVIRVRNTQ